MKVEIWVRRGEFKFHVNSMLLVLGNEMATNVKRTLANLFGLWNINGYRTTCIKLNLHQMENNLNCNATKCKRCCIVGMEHL